MIKRELDRIAFYLDTNMINARGKLEYMNKLEKWRDMEIILMDMPKTAFLEAQQGTNNVEERRKKVFNYLWGKTDIISEQQFKVLQSIQEILFPDGILETDPYKNNKWNDVDIVFTAKEVGAILISNDGNSRRQAGGILGNKDRLKTELNIRVMTDKEAYYYVLDQLHIRNKHIEEYCRRTGERLPEWLYSDLQV